MPASVESVYGASAGVTGADRGDWAPGRSSGRRAASGSARAGRRGATRSA